MLEDSIAFSGFSVDDVTAAKEFYGQKLGREVTETQQGLTLHFAAGNEVFIYPKPNHVSATYTMLNFLVSDIDAAVEKINGEWCGI